MENNTTAKMFIVNKYQRIKGQGETLVFRIQSKNRALGLKDLINVAETSVLMGDKYAKLQLVEVIPSDTDEDERIILREIIIRTKN